eukprot:GGOE01042684.1.p2 GENE.GGOE01042684.1~~GGOE01042684.1.p2  ORF type:complete len:183 (+),score=30.11 GGOE01042684.1:56-604(+)
MLERLGSTFLGKQNETAAFPSCVSDAEAPSPYYAELSAASAADGKRQADDETKERPGLPYWCNWFAEWTAARLKGYALLCLTSTVVSFAAWYSFGRWVRFGLLFSLANALSLLSGCALYGPRRHLQAMCSADRGPTSTVYVASIAADVLYCECYSRKGNGAQVPDLILSSSEPVFFLRVHLP